eukprot:UN06945
MHYKFLQNALKLKLFQKIAKNFSKKIKFGSLHHLPPHALLSVFLSLQKSNPCFTLKMFDQNA